VLLDWGLPRLGGSAVFRKLKEMNPQVKVLASAGTSISILEITC